MTSLFAGLDLLHGLQLQLSNNLYYERPTSHPIVIVAIDNKSLSDDQGLGRFQDWKRSYYAQAIDNLEKYQPAAIGLDIFFRTRSSTLSDTEITNILNTADPVQELKKYLPEQINPEDQKLVDTFNQYKNIVTVPSLPASSNGGLLNPQALVNPYSAFLNTAVQVGLNTIYPDQDGIIRQTNFNFRFTDNTVKKSFDQILINLFDKNFHFDSPQDPFLINFTTRTILNLTNYQSDKFKFISFSDVYKNQFPSSFDPNYLKGKIILIGSYYQLSGDNFTTPIDPNNPYAGVMIHAQTIQTVLDHAWLRNTTLPEQIFVILLLVLITMLISFKIKIRYSLLGVLFLILIYNLLLAPLFFRGFGIILNLVYPNIAVILSLIIVYAFRYFTEFRQKSSLQTNLGKFVDQSVIQESLRENANIKASISKEEITVMFTDIANFTSISETLQPTSAVEFLNEYLGAMTAIIVKHGGTIDKFEGDAIMALFGAPISQEDHAQRAAAAALEMRAKLPELNQKWKNDPPLSGGEKKPQIDFRVGLSSGEAVVGNIGSENRLSYTAIGDIVNLGSRLESANKQYASHILISEKTYNLLNNSFVCRFTDFIRVKGKHQPIKTFELLGTIDQISPEEKELLEIYNEGLEFYFQKNFEQALDIFQNKLLLRFPNDNLSLIYAGRCQLLKRYPPAADWDFVYEMKNK